MELKPHQAEAVEKMSNGCVLAGGVGVGKTHTALAYYVLKACGGFLDRSQGPMSAPKELIVITTAKKRNDRDWQSTALDFGIFEEAEYSYSGVSITVDSYNNIEKYLDRQGAFFIFDEQRLVGSGAWVKAFLKIAKVNQWILLSATPADNWIDYVPIFIANGFYRNRTEFVDNHVVWTFHGRYRKIRGYYGVKQLRAYRDAILVDMPFERHTLRHLELVEVAHDAQRFDKVWKKLWNVYDNVPLVDVSEKHRIGRKVVNSDGSRIDKILELWEKHPRLVIFYNFDYELEALRDIASVSVLNAKTVGKEGDRDNIYVGRPSKWGNPFVIGKDGSREEVIAKYEEYLITSDLCTQLGELRGKNLICWCSPEPCHADVLAKYANQGEIAEWNGHKHQSVPETDRWLYLVQYMAGSEGWNCTTTDAIVFYSLTYSHKQFEQAQGRIDRMNTPYVDLWYYILLSKAKIDQIIWQAVSTKKNFHEGRNVKYGAAA